MRLDGAVLAVIALAPALLAQIPSSDPGGILRHLTVARFIGSGKESIQAMASDAAGNVYVAGTTSSPDLPVKNAAQPSIGEAVVMRSLDRGVTWQKVPAPLTLPVTITPHPRDPQTLFLGAGDGIYKTVDGGQTWRHVYSKVPLNRPCCPKFNIAIDPANTRKAYAYIFADNGSYEFLASSDSGDSWERRNLPSTLAAAAQSTSSVLWVDPDGSGIVGLSMWLSRDAGLSWTRMTLPPRRSPSFAVPDPRHTGWIYMEASAGTGGSLYLSKDWGQTWMERASPTRPGESFQQAITELLFDPDLPDILYANAILSGLMISNDAGASWRPLAGQRSVNPNRRAAVLGRQCMGGALLVVSGGLAGAVSSLDFGTTWQPTELPRVLDLAAGPGCAFYAVRSIASDAFVAKVGPDLEVVWSTFLGGSDGDSPAGLALDTQGNVYVAGYTASADFPSRHTRRVGRNAFAVKLDAEGNLIYSVVFGGDMTGLSVNAQGEAHIAGWTYSTSFSATPGAFQTEPGDGDGFAAKLDSRGNMVYASYLPGFARPPYLGYQGPYLPAIIAVAAEPSGSAVFGGYGGVLSRMSPDGSSLVSLPRQPGQIYRMETDEQGNIYVAGQTDTDSGSGSCFQWLHRPPLPPADIFVNKLQPDGLQQVFSARLAGACHSRPTALKVSPSGETTVGLWTLTEFPVRNPVLPFSNCSRENGAAAVSRFSADGSELLFSSYLDMCAQAPAIALAPDGALYAGVTRGLPGDTSSRSGILRIPVAQTDRTSVMRAVNALSSSKGFAVPGMLLTVTGQNLASASIDLGLNNPNPLPTELGGVRVLFDDVPAEMFRVAPDQLICVVPAGVKERDSVKVQVVSEGWTSTPFVLPVLPSNIGLLTHSFPALPSAGSVDGNIRNADGTLNDAEHPAAPGSTVTLFATGLAGPGPVRLLWNGPPESFVESLEYLSGTARRMPGFVDALYAVDFRIPDTPGPGVYLVPTPGVLTRAVIGRVGSGLGVYVK